MINALFGEDYIPRCPKCEVPLNGPVIDYGLAEDKYYFVRRCNNKECKCNSKLYYERNMDLYPAPKKKEPLEASDVGVIRLKKSKAKRRKAQ